jgi:hypothetical protein
MRVAEQYTPRPSGPGGRDASPSGVTRRVDRRSDAVRLVVEGGLGLRSGVGDWAVRCAQLRARREEGAGQGRLCAPEVRLCAPAATPWLAALRQAGGMIKREQPTPPVLPATAPGSPLAATEGPVATWSAGPRGPARIYKSRSHSGSRKGPRCIACFPRSCAGQRVPLPYGVSLALCGDHRDPRFVASQAGRAFLAAIGDLFSSLGLTARRYGAALAAFVEQVRRPERPRRPRPGSYAWAPRRRDAEAVWSAGGSFERGLTIALADPPAPRARTALPSSRTVRRWWQDRRWLPDLTAS